MCLQYCTPTPVCATEHFRPHRHAQCGKVRRSICRDVFTNWSEFGVDRLLGPLRAGSGKLSVTDVYLLCISVVDIHSLSEWDPWYLEFWLRDGCHCGGWIPYDRVVNGARCDEVNEWTFIFSDVLFLENTNLSHDLSMRQQWIKFHHSNGSI